MHQQQLHEATKSFKDKRILVVGDVMLDRYVSGAVNRLSPEAPVPVLSVQDKRSMLGGAGNVARNLIALGAQVSFATLIGGDKYGHEIAGMLGEMKGLHACLITESKRMTTKKTRYIAGGQQLLRADQEDTRSMEPASVQQMMAFIQEEMPKCDAVIISDYDKGVLRDQFASSIIAVARKNQRPVFVDPKQANFGLYAGATIITPNLAELSGASPNRAFMPIETETDIALRAWQLREMYNFGAVLVTRGRSGMSLVETDDDAFHIPSRAREVFDVSGAGDTVIATLALGVTAGLTFPEAARLANIAAGVVVGRSGTATVTSQDLAFAIEFGDAFLGSGKVVPMAEAAIRSAQWSLVGQTVAFTNGCFDLMHSGHLEMLRRTRAIAEEMGGTGVKLVVGVNGDDSVRSLKGQGRPVNNEMERAHMLAALAIVDLVVIFHDDSPLGAIKAVRPKLLTKGGDYRPEEVIGREFVIASGGRMEIIPRSTGKSTTGIFEACRLYSLASRLPQATS